MQSDLCCARLGQTNFLFDSVECSVLPDLSMRINFVSSKFKLSLFVFQEDFFISAQRHSEEKNLVQTELALDIAAALLV